MPATHFVCPDGQRIKIESCLTKLGCRLGTRCATLPYLRLIGFDRKWKGVSPSSAGNGPRLLYLKAEVSYSINPQDRVWAAFGTSTHDNLGMHKHSDNVLSEEKLSDDIMSGIADVLEEDEQKPGRFIITDYKNFGSFKVAKALGLIIETTEETILDKEGKPVLLKSGPNKGQPKTQQKTERKYDPTQIDLRAEEYQINRYRIFYEQKGFPISRLQLQVLVRDGGTFIAKNRGIDKNLYIISIKRLLNTDVLAYYKQLSDEVLEAFKTGYARKCNLWESWDRRRCEGFCEVVEDCKSMSKTHNEKWGLI